MIEKAPNCKLLIFSTHTCADKSFSSFLFDTFETKILHHYLEQYYRTKNSAGCFKIDQPLHLPMRIDNDEHGLYRDYDMYQLPVNKAVFRTNSDLKVSFIEYFIPRSHYRLF